MMKGETTFERPWLASWPEGVPKSIDYPEISVHELLRRAAKDFGNRPAITFYGKSLSYRDLDAAVDRFAAGLRAIGVRSGDRVSSSSRTRPTSSSRSSRCSVREALSCRRIRCTR